MAKTKSKKPVIGVQVSHEEKQKLDKIVAAAGRSQSNIIRGAILYLLKAVEAGNVKVSDNPENW